MRDQFRPGEILGAAAILLGVFQMLWIPWFAGATTFYSIAGYLPWSDASWWLHGGLRLLLDGRLDGISATRIVNESFMAALLGIAGERLRIALILRAILIAAAIFLFAREIAYRLGVVPAAVTTVVMLAFLAGFTRTTMTEPTGLLYGTLGAALLLATGDRTPGLLAAGAFLIALGLVARPGPFLVLPMLVLWAGREFRGERRFAIRPALWATAGMAAAAAVTAVLSRLYTSPGTVSFANFAYTLYGLAHGGQSWAILLQTGSYGAHPERVMEQAIAIIRANPRLLLGGMCRFVFRFLTDQLLYIDSYPWQCCSVYRYSQWYRAPFVVLEVTGLIYALRRGRSKTEHLCLLTFAGCVLSSAFIFWDSEAYRTFAATNALEALLVGSGAAVVCRGLGRAPRDDCYFTSSARAVCVIGAAIVALSLFAPSVARIVGLHSRSSQGPELRCAAS